MNTVKLKPEKELKTLWIITWVIMVVLGILFLLFFIFAVDWWIAGISVLGWVVIMIPVIIWIPYAFRALEYYIDDEGVKMKGGVIWKKFVTVPYPKITNVDITQGPVQRYYNIGTIHVQTAGAGGQQGQKAELKMNGIRELEDVRNMILKKVKGSTYSLSNTDTEEKKAETAVSGEVSVFEEILKELREIKSLIGKR
ncbi:MAG: PH domain-containing protein [Actinomycetota bacterium]|nr:PH domain-containing protein [Actinomycetota bacterium]